MLNCSTPPTPNPRSVHVPSCQQRCQTADQAIAAIRRGKDPPSFMERSDGRRSIRLLDTATTTVNVSAPSPPFLSYVTINALWAANGIVVPVPPSGLDFASSAQVGALLADLGANLDCQTKHGARKNFDFLHVLLSRVDAADPAMPAVRQWIQATYGEYTLPVEIPKTSVTSNKAAEFATIYDVQKYEGSAKTYKRAADAYDAFVDLVEQSVVGAWTEPEGNAP